MKTYTFPNGFRILHEKPKTDIPLTSISCFVKLGSIYEPEKIKGASHFIEHMCFKGTKKMPHSSFISHHYDGIGAYFNAYTEKEYTCYQIKCGEERMKDTLHILGDMMMNSIFKKEEFTKEYKVIVEENIKSEDNMEILIVERIESLLYSGTPYALPIDTLSYHKKPMKYENVIQIYRHFYRPENMVLSIVSHIPFSTIKSIVESSFFMIKRDVPTRIPESFVYIEPQPDVKCNIYKKPNLTATYLHISFRTCPYENPDRYSLYLLSQIIGGTFSSRLFSLLREENGLTYSSDSEVVFYKHSGHFSIKMILNPQKILKNGEKKGVLPLVIGLLNDLYKNGVKKEEIDLIKGYIKGQFTIKMEDSLHQTEYNGKNVLLYESEFTPYTKIFEKHYKSIKKVGIDAVIKKYLKKSNMSVCVLGTAVPSLDVLTLHCSEYIG